MIQGECLGQQILLTIRVRTETNSLDSTDRPLSYWPTAGIVKLGQKLDSEAIRGETRPSKHLFKPSEQIRRTSLQVRLREVKSLHPSDTVSQKK